LSNRAKGMLALATPGGDHGGRGRCSTPISCERRVAPVCERTPRCGKRRHVPRIEVTTGQCWHGIGSSRLPANVSIWLENFHRMTIDGEQVEGGRGLPEDYTCWIVLEVNRSYASDESWFYNVSYISLDASFFPNILNAKYRGFCWQYNGYMWHMFSSKYVLHRRWLIYFSLPIGLY
jgi:hypothetical protein